MNDFGWMAIKINNTYKPLIPVIDSSGNIVALVKDPKDVELIAAAPILYATLRMVKASIDDTNVGLLMQIDTVLNVVDGK